MCILYTHFSGWKFGFRVLLTCEIQELETQTDDKPSQRIVEEIINTKANEKKTKVELRKLQSRSSVMTLRVQQSIMKPLLDQVQVPKL